MSTAPQTSMSAQADMCDRQTTGGDLAARSRQARLSASSLPQLQQRGPALLLRQDIVGSTLIRVEPKASGTRVHNRSSACREFAASRCINALDIDLP